MTYIAEVGPVALPLATVHICLAAQGLFWDSLSLVVLLASCWNLERDTIGGYSMIFWLSILTAILLEMAAWSWWLSHYNSLPNDVAPDWEFDWDGKDIHAYVVTVSLSLYEFAFSIVNLSLQSLGSIFHMKTRAREYGWLAFNFFQVPMSVAITALQMSYGTENQSQFWALLFNCAMQSINITVFGYWFWSTLSENQDVTMSQPTARMYARVLTRFFEYLLVYLVYTIIFFLGAMVTIVDIANAGNRSWLVLVMVTQIGYFACRYFLVFTAVYIFNPAWVRAVESRIVSTLKVMPLTSMGGALVSGQQTSGSTTGVNSKPSALFGSFLEAPRLRRKNVGSDSVHVTIADVDESSVP